MSAAFPVSSFQFPVSSFEALKAAPFGREAARLLRRRAGQVPSCPDTHNCPAAEEDCQAAEQVCRLPFQVSRDGAARERFIELPPVVPASRLEDRPAPATVLTGIGELDALTGGLPRGALTEICGPASSGRTSALLALMAAMTQRHEVCALVDASDSFDPRSAEAAGVELRRLLWIRCSTQRHRGTEKSSADGRGSGQWVVASGQPRSQITNRKSQMDSLEQALKATDLLLQGGGFGLVVVDLGDVPAQAARRVPLTSWFRFRRAVENTRTVLVVIEQEPYAKTCASVVIRLSAVGRRLSAASTQQSALSNQPHSSILDALEIRAELVRDAHQRKKPVQSVVAQWESRTVWAG